MRCRLTSGSGREALRDVLAYNYQCRSLSRGTVHSAPCRGAAGRNGESPMVCCFHLRLKAVVAGAASLLLLAFPGLAEGQMLPEGQALTAGQALRGPDLGLWFRQ